MVKSTYCSLRGPGFNFQHLYGGSQLSIAPDRGDPPPSFDLHRYQAQANKILIEKIDLTKKKEVSLSYSSFQHIHFLKFFLYWVCIYMGVCIHEEIGHLARVCSLLPP